MKAKCSNCAMNIEGTCRAMPINVNPESPRLVGVWPKIDPRGWCSWHRRDMFALLRWDDGTSRA